MGGTSAREYDKWYIHSFITYAHFFAQVNKNVLSSFLNEILLREGSFILTGRSFQIVGPETLNDLGPNVIVLVLGMYSCPDIVDCNCSWPGIDEIAPWDIQYRSM